MTLYDLPYIPKRAPMAHQARGFNASVRAKGFFYGMDPRTGKTKLTIDITAAAYERGTIDGLLIGAPKGVDLNWVTDELPIDMPDRIPTMVLVFRGGKCETKAFKEAFARLLNFKGLAVLAMNHEAFATPRGKAHAEKFLRKRKVLFALDESAAIKTPSAARTKAITALGRLAVARRCLDGTPNAESPLELFAQYRFLDPTILGFTNFTSFKARYAQMEQGYDPRSGRRFDKVVGYAHLDELMDKIAPFTFRVRRDEVMDMPAKVYQRIRYELSEEQRRVYDSLTETYRAELKSGESISVNNVLSRYLRLQQVLSNRLPSSKIVLCPQCFGDGCDYCNDQGIVGDTDTTPVIVDTAHNPRLEAANEQLILAKSSPTILWTRFRIEADDLCKLGKDLGRKVCRYDGSCSDAVKSDSKAGFKGGVYDFMVASPAAAGRGLTFAVGHKTGRLMLYYSNYFALRLRLQSEDRMEGLGLEQGTDVLDLCANDTVDEEIIQALRDKDSLSRAIQRDPERAWI